VEFEDLSALVDLFCLPARCFQSSSATIAGAASLFRALTVLLPFLTTSLPKEDDLFGAVRTCLLMTK